MNTNKFLDKVESALRDFDAEIKGPLITDGELHRLRFTGKKGKNKDIAYSVHLDGVPNAYIKNWHTGEEVKIPYGEALTPAERTKACQVIKFKRDKKPAQITNELVLSKETALKVYLAGNIEGVDNHPHVIAKHIHDLAKKSLRVNDNGTLLIPYYSLPNNIDECQILQTIGFVNADGRKLFMKGGIKTGTCFPIGDTDSAKVVAVTESYSNADAIHTATGGRWSVLCSGSAGSLGDIAKRAKAYWIDKPIVIVGDNDFSKENNPGRTAATKGAQEAGVPVIFPDFKPKQVDPFGKPPSDIWDYFYLHDFSYGHLSRFLGCSLERAKNWHLDYVYLDEVETEQQTWLWPGVIPDGEYSVIAGQPGCGKSQIVASIIAAVTTGGDLPAGAGKAQRGRVLLFDGEDNLSKTIKPRLLAAGADLRRIQYIKGARKQGGVAGQNLLGMKLSRDLTSIGKHIENQKRRDDVVRLIVFDPLASYLTGDANNNTEVRAQLELLANFAERYDISTLGILHTNKASGGGNTFSALDRIAGAGAFTQVSRSTYVAVKDPKNENKRYLLPVKVNIARDDTGYSYRIEEYNLESGIATSRVVWDNETNSESANAILAQTSKKRISQLDKAEQYLRGRLADGSVEYQILVKEALDERISIQTLYRARSEIGIIGTKIDGKKHWELMPVSPGKGAQG